MKGTIGAISLVRVSRHSYSVANAAAPPGVWGPSQNRRRDRRTYQLDRSSMNAPSRRPAALVSNSSKAAVTSEVTHALEEFDTAAAGRRLAAFVDDLSNWYVRRSRRRFWEGPGTPGGAAAFATLYQCLETLTRLMAPIVPFLTDHVWGILRGSEDPESVHLTTWPGVDPGLVDRELSAQMGLARRLVELGRSARAAVSLGIRQPLPRALAGAAGFAGLPAELRDQVASELNVRALEALSTVGDDLVDHVVKPNFRTLGRRFGNRTQAVAAAITGADPATLAAELQDAGTASVLVDGNPVNIGPDDVILTQTPRTGWSVASDGGETVALDLDVTPELRREGLAREVIRLVQDARKADGLEVSDRITLRWEAPDPELAAALTEHGQLIAGEVLATEFGPLGTAVAGPAAAPVAGTGHRAADLGLTFWIRKP